MNPKGNPENLKPFSSTYQPKNPGRKPSIFKKYEKFKSISTADMRLLLGTLVHKYDTIDKIKTALGNPNTKTIEKIFLTAIIKDMGKGITTTVQFLTQYGYGLPKQEIEQSGEIAAIVMTPEDRNKEIDKMLAKRSEDEKNTDQM